MNEPHQKAHAYNRTYFIDQAAAERAFFRVLAESEQRGREIARLSRKLGAARKRGKSVRQETEQQG